MKQYVSMVPKGHPNRPGLKLEALKAIVVHYTGNEHPTMTDTANVRWISRSYVNKGSKIYETDGVTPFRFGSAHVFFDMDSMTMALPLDEVAWGVGDRSHNKGFMPIAHSIFKQRQNYCTLSVEICNNDVVRNSTVDWDTAVINAREWIINHLIRIKTGIDLEGSLNPQKAVTIEKGKVLLLRHFDITGKNCPAHFVKHKAEWETFVRYVAEKVNEGSYE